MNFFLLLTLGLFISYFFLAALGVNLGYLFDFPLISSGYCYEPPPAFTESNGFWIVMFLFSFISMDFLNFFFDLFSDLLAIQKPDV